MFIYKNIYKILISQLFLDRRKDKNIGAEMIINIRYSPYQLGVKAFMRKTAGKNDNLFKLVIFDPLDKPFSKSASFSLDKKKKGDIILLSLLEFLLTIELFSVLDVINTRF